MSKSWHTVRLESEYRAWKRSHPFGFDVKIHKNIDGDNLNLMEWFCSIPGRSNTPWEGGHYKLTMTFCEDYSCTPPECKFDPPIFHPNVYPSGIVRLSLLDGEKDWFPSTPLQTVLLKIQDLLHEPNIDTPANDRAHRIYNTDLKAYERIVRQQARAMSRRE